MIEMLIYTLVVTHITILCVTLYLHRSQAHRSVVFHPVIAHAMRWWLWLTTGMITKEWVAVHRKHHRFCEQSDDPHSPVQRGIWRVLFGGAWLYNTASKDKKMVESYGAGTPTDWIERHLYTPHSKMGLVSLLIVTVLIWGWCGIVIWSIQMLWIPSWAAGVINGLGHWVGYRTGNTADNSRNLIPWAIWIGGEELHHNHHLDPASAKLSKQWWEFDWGWAMIRILQFLGLARTKSA